MPVEPVVVVADGGDVQMTSRRCLRTSVPLPELGVLVEDGCILFVHARPAGSKRVPVVIVAHAVEVVDHAEAVAPERGRSRSSRGNTPPRRSS